MGDLNSDGSDDLINLSTQNSNDGVSVYTHYSTGNGFNTVYYNELNGYDGVTDYTTLDLSHFLVGDFGI